jgi:DNA-binding ferritin-like protein
MKHTHSKTNKLNTKLSFNLTPRSFSHRAGTHKKHDTTQKNNKSSKNIVVFQKNITLKFLQILNTVKLYHWKTKSYASHKATDELYTKLNDLFDQFTEILLGKLNNRIHLEKYKTLPLKDMASDQDMVKEMQLFKNYLVLA